MRFFIALEIPDTNKTQLKDIQHQLKLIIPQIRLTDNEKLHLTLAFIGTQPDEKVQQLIQIIQSAVSGISSFEVTPAYIDAFPNLHHPKIFWAGVKGDVGKLFILRERIKDSLKDLGIHIDERRYTPHIALGKVPILHLSKEQEKKLQEMFLTTISSIPIRSIKLFESIPDHDFHSHNTLAEIPLTKI